MNFFLATNFPNVVLNWKADIKVLQNWHFTEMPEAGLAAKVRVLKVDRK